MSNPAKNRIHRLIEALEPQRLTRVMDIGANPIHRPPYQDLLDMKACEVWGFEPQPDAYEQLLTSASPLEHYYPHAIGDGSLVNLHICKSEGFTSILPPNLETLEYLDRWQNAMHVTKTIPVKTKRLDDLELPSPDFLKIDVQGAEKLIFENATRTLSDTTCIVSEVAFVPLYLGQPLYHHQAQTLEDMGFSLTKFMFLKRKSLGSDLMSHLNWRKHQNQIIDGDAVFARKPGSDGSVKDEQIKHLAICADAVFDSHDLAAKCLSLLLKKGRVKEQAVLDYLALVPHQKQS